MSRDAEIAVCDRGWLPWDLEQDILDRRRLAPSCQLVLQSGLRVDLEQIARSILAAWLT